MFRAARKDREPPRLWPVARIVAVGFLASKATTF